MPSWSTYTGRDLTDEEEVKEVKSAKWNETGNKGHTGKCS